MGRKETPAIPYMSRQHGSVGYGAGSTPDSKTLYAKAFIQTDGLGGVTYRDGDNIGAVSIVGNEIQIEFTREFESGDPRYSTYVVQQEAHGGGDPVPRREFYRGSARTPAGFRIQAVDQAGVAINHGASIRAYYVETLGRGNVRG